MIDPRRQAVIDEAKTWLRTPFHHEGRIKGAGVDCLMLLAEVYERCGVIEHIDPPHYTPDWFNHRDEEKYMTGLLDHARKVDDPQPGNVALFRYGRTYSHGTIITEWPRLIHAYWENGVVYGDATLFPLAGRKVRFFDPF